MFSECKDSANRTKYQIYLDIFEVQPIFASFLRQRYNIFQYPPNFRAYFFSSFPCGEMCVNKLKIARGEASKIERGGAS